jgi:hypothetical protein
MNDLLLHKENVGGKLLDSELFYSLTCILVWTKFHLKNSENSKLNLTDRRDTNV